MARVMFGNEPRQTENSPISGDPADCLSWLLVLPPHLRKLTEESLGPLLADAEEVRLRINRPIMFRMSQLEATADQEKKLTTEYRRGYVITRADLEKTINTVCQSSFYAWEEEVRGGFITVSGGHRVGLVGRSVMDKGQIKTIKEISGLNIRIGRQVPGCADEVVASLLRERHVAHTLVVSPPQCGKTTLLRDIIRQISDGVEKLNFPGVNVGVVDERSELAGMHQGQPQFDLGLRTDVLDACPKAQGMMLLIRSMSPAVIATDEIGRPEDVEAVYNALQAGVSVITTVHGENLAEVEERPAVSELLRKKFFQRIVILSRRQGPGTLECVLDGRTLEKVKAC